MHPAKVGLGEDVHRVLGLKPQAQASSKKICGELGLVGYYAEKEPLRLVGNMNALSLVGSF